jgi:hypothetical protein
MHGAHSCLRSCLNVHIQFISEINEQRKLVTRPDLNLRIPIGEVQRAYGDCKNKKKAEVVPPDNIRTTKNKPSWVV